MLQLQAHSPLLPACMPAGGWCPMALQRLQAEPAGPGGGAAGRHEVDRTQRHQLAGGPTGGWDSSRGGYPWDAGCQLCKGRLLMCASAGMNRQEFNVCPAVSHLPCCLTLQLSLCSPCRAGVRGARLLRGRRPLQGLGPSQEARRGAARQVRRAGQCGARRCAAGASYSCISAAWAC